MSAECQHGGNSSVKSSPFHRRGNHSGVSQMHPVKHPHGPVYGGGKAFQSLEFPVNDHMLPGNQNIR